MKAFQKKKKCVETEREGDGSKMRDGRKGDNKERKQKLSGSNYKRE